VGKRVRGIEIYREREVRRKLSNLFCEEYVCQTRVCVSNARCVRQVQMQTLIGPKKWAMKSLLLSPICPALWFNAMLYTRSKNS
jgi:hypothetical protein